MRYEIAVSHLHGLSLSLLLPLLCFPLIFLLFSPFHPLLSLLLFYPVLSLCFLPFLPFSLPTLLFPLSLLVEAVLYIESIQHIPSGKFSDKRDSGFGLYFLVVFPTFLSHCFLFLGTCKTASEPNARDS